MSDDRNGLPTITRVMNAQGPIIVQSFSSPFPFLESPLRPDEIGRLGDYRVLRLLGQGGMAFVFLAEDTQLRRQVALKVMKPSASHEPSADQRFLREARLLASIKHDHVVTVYQVGQQAPAVFLAMELLKGQTLDEWVAANGPPDVLETLRIAREIAGGLDAMHANGLLHRDLKPNNLWVEEPGRRIKLLDFGLVRSMTEDVRLTDSNLILGTPAFMSPEQARGEPLDARSDLFSLGGVLYFLCSGRLPFQADTAVGTLTSVVLDHPPPIGEVNPRLPRPTAALIMRLLEKKAENRPATAREVIRRIEEMETCLACFTPMPTPVVPMAPAPSELFQFSDPSDATADPVEKRPELRRWRRNLWATGLTLSAGLVVTLGFNKFVRQPRGGSPPEAGSVASHPAKPDRAAPPAAAKPTGPQTPAKPKGVLVLDDCESQTRGKGQYFGKLSLLNVMGNKEFRISDLNVCSTMGSSRMVAGDPQRECIWVIENTAKRIRRFDHQGRVTLTINCEENGTALAVDPPTGNVWVLLGGTPIGNGKLVVYSPEGTVVATQWLFGWDIAYDAKAKAFWVASPHLSKINAATMEVLFTAKIPGFRVACVDVDPVSGSAWVGVRVIEKSVGSTNQLLKFDPEGVQTLAVELGEKAPHKVSVDHANGRVWVANFRRSVEAFTFDGKSVGEHNMPALTVQADPFGGCWAVTREETLKMTVNGTVTKRVLHAATTESAWIATLD